jgi:hypothetical protein
MPHPVDFRAIFPDIHGNPARQRQGGEGSIVIFRLRGNP